MLEMRKKLSEAGTMQNSCHSSTSKVQQDMAVCQHGTGGSIPSPDELGPDVAVCLHGTGGSVPGPTTRALTTGSALAK